MWRVSRSCPRPWASRLAIVSCGTRITGSEGEANGNHPAICSGDQRSTSLAALGRRARPKAAASAAWAR
jgi:hypothetical protein